MKLFQLINLVLLGMVLLPGAQADGINAYERALREYESENMGDNASLQQLVTNFKVENKFEAEKSKVEDSLKKKSEWSSDDKKALSKTTIKAAQSIKSMMKNGVTLESSLSLASSIVDTISLATGQPEIGLIFDTITSIITIFAASPGPSKEQVLFKQITQFFKKELKALKQDISEKMAKFHILEKITECSATLDSNYDIADWLQKTIVDNAVNWALNVKEEVIITSAKAIKSCFQVLSDSIIDTIETVEQDINFGLTFSKHLGYYVNLISRAQNVFSQRILLWSRIRVKQKGNKQFEQDWRFKIGDDILALGEINRNAKEFLTNLASKQRFWDVYAAKRGDGTVRTLRTKDDNLVVTVGALMNKMICDCGSSCPEHSNPFEEVLFHHPGQWWESKCHPGERKRSVTGQILQNFGANLGLVQYLTCESSVQASTIESILHLYGTDVAKRFSCPTNYLQTSVDYSVKSNVEPSVSLTSANREKDRHCPPFRTPVGCRNCRVEPAEDDVNCAATCYCKMNAIEHKKHNCEMPNGRFSSKCNNCKIEKDVAAGSCTMGCTCESRWRTIDLYTCAYESTVLFDDMTGLKCEVGVENVPVGTGCQIELFDHIDGGCSAVPHKLPFLKYTSSQPNLPANWNDRVTSFRISGDCKFTAYEDANYKGSHRTFSGPGIQNFDRSFNDLLASFKLEKAGEMQRTEEKCSVKIVEDDGKMFGGKQIGKFKTSQPQLSRSTYSGKTLVVINGLCAFKAFTEEKYQGRSRTYFPQPHKMQSLNYNPKSFAIEFCRVQLFQRSDGKDSIEYFLESQHKATWKKEASSIKITGNCKLIAYDDAGYKGHQDVYYGSSVQNLKNKMNSFRLEPETDIWRKSTISYDKCPDRGNVRSEDGELVCVPKVIESEKEGKKSASAKCSMANIKGNWMKRCRDWSLWELSENDSRGDCLLKASCKTRHETQMRIIDGKPQMVEGGKFVPNDFFHFQNGPRKCLEKQLYNDDGTLKCRDACPYYDHIPFGTYRSKCNGCAVDENCVLKCHCKPRKGTEYKETSLDLFSCKYIGDVVNSNGELKCHSCNDRIAPGVSHWCENHEWYHMKHISN